MTVTAEPFVPPPSSTRTPGSTWRGPCPSSAPRWRPAGRSRSPCPARTCAWSGTRRARTPTPYGSWTCARPAAPPAGSSPACCGPSPTAGRRVHIVGELVWADRGPAEHPACAQHEALINSAFQGREVTIGRGRMPGRHAAGPAGRSGATGRGPGAGPGLRRVRPVRVGVLRRPVGPGPAARPGPPAWRRVPGRRTRPAGRRCAPGRRSPRGASRPGRAAGPTRRPS